MVLVTRTNVQIFGVKGLIRYMRPTRDTELLSPFLSRVKEIQTLALATAGVTRTAGFLVA